MTATEHVDVVVLGAGSAGTNVAWYRSPVHREAERMQGPLAFYFERVDIRAAGRAE